MSPASYSSLLSCPFPLGFPVPSRNIFSFAHIQTSFLTSFFPVSFIFPLSFLWNIADFTLRWYQPYIVLSQGNARAEDSLMLDYVGSNRLMSLFKTMKKREWIIHLSMSTALASNLFQPLAGALLSVKQVPKTRGMLFFSTLMNAKTLISVGSHSVYECHYFRSDPRFQHSECLPCCCRCTPSFIRLGITSDAKHI